MFRSHVLKAAATGVAAILALSACGAGTSTSSAETIKVGALAVPAGDMLKHVQRELTAKEGLTVDYKEFSDYNTPNPAVSDGDIDANLFQNTTFMETYNKASGKDLVSVGKVYLPPMALYSNNVASLEELPDGASIAIPNDPTNESRALKLLASKGLIEVSDNPITLKDVTANPKNFQFTEIENASLPQALNDKDAAIVTLAFAPSRRPERRQAAAGRGPGQRLLQRPGREGRDEGRSARSEAVQDPDLAGHEGFPADQVQGPGDPGELTGT